MSFYVGRYSIPFIITAIVVVLMLLGIIGAFAADLKVPHRRVTVTVHRPSPLRLPEPPIRMTPELMPMIGVTPLK